MLSFSTDTCGQFSHAILVVDFSHDHARSRAYRWGEDGIAGVSDTHNLQNIAFSFWNGKEYVLFVVTPRVSPDGIAYRSRQPVTF